jgi:uncharacterized membrane protein
VKRYWQGPDDGTVLLLIIGLVTLAALLVSVVTDASALYLERRRLVSAADGAALAGAQKVNEARVYSEGLPATGPVPLDPSAAESAAREYLANSGIALSEVSVHATPTTVSVRVWSRYQLPVASTVTAGGAGSATVSASATARTAVVP